MRRPPRIAIFLALALASSRALAAAQVDLTGDVMPLLKARCVKCHGPGKRESKLNLSTPGGVARGGETGPAVNVQNPAESLLWKRVLADEMPPEEPLAAEEKALLERWVTSGAKGLPTAKDLQQAGSDHWAFTRLTTPDVPQPREPSLARTDVDRFLLAELQSRGLAFNPQADRATLIRRVSFDLNGLPPTLEEIERFQSDTSADAYEQMVERYLASPHFGERWGKYWLDAAGYADSNGYFNADSDRPLAYRYRDYVVRALNQDKPFDRFVLEQLAGDELAGFTPGEDATPEVISLLEATHYLRNGQDGTGESDGNADEVRTDRYAALESAEQIVSSSLLGLTMQCAKCHDHKFEPVTQRDFYQLQSVFYPAFNIQKWLKPNERVVYASLSGEQAAWQARVKRADQEIARLKAELTVWLRANPPPSTVLFRDEFDDGGPPLADHWSATAPGDDTPGGSPAVALDSDQAPAALRAGGSLKILEAGAGDRWLSTRQSFNWTPEKKGEWIQVTFDLIDNKASAGAQPAERIAYFIAAHDFNDNSAAPGGNVLVDGNPAGGAAVHLDYPGEDSRPLGDLGNSKYEPGHNYGVRLTRLDDSHVRLDHLVDHLPDEKSLKLKTADLPNGGFGFEYCCGRSFVVDNVVIERSAEGAGAEKAATAIVEKQKEFTAAIKALENSRGERPGKIAWVTDFSTPAPDVFLLERGNYGSPGEKVRPAPLSPLDDSGGRLAMESPAAGKTTGRRLAWARWLLRPDSRSAALVARVQVNRMWQHLFGAGIVTTLDNLGASGSPPSHPQLIDYLADRFIRSGWSVKNVLRLLTGSHAYRQTSAASAEPPRIDPDNRLLWRYGVKRLDAEALRDAILAVSGGLDRQFGGPYIPTMRDDAGEVLVPENTAGSLRRSIYLQQRRTQMLSFLNVFDSPTIVFNCVQRPASTMPLQSLSLLNSPFVVSEGRRFAERLARETSQDTDSRLKRAFQLALAREASEQEIAASREFLDKQCEQYGNNGDAKAKSWADFCQMLMSSNAFLYVE